MTTFNRPKSNRGLQLHTDKALEPDGFILVCLAAGVHAKKVIGHAALRSDLRSQKS
jgi:hypothetical protein